MCLFVMFVHQNCSPHVCKNPITTNASVFSSETEATTTETLNAKLGFGKINKVARNVFHPAVKCGSKAIALGSAGFIVKTQNFWEFFFF